MVSLLDSVDCLVIPEILLLIEQICPGAAEVDDLRASVSILLEASTLEAVECVRDALHKGVKSALVT